MSTINTTSQQELQKRRQKLRTQRRWRWLKITWQTVVVSGLAGGLFWTIAQPLWLITQPEQITVEGNQLMSDQTIISHLSISYPQTLWDIQPETLAQKLESQGAIASATVRRHILPPGLTIEVKEREPVAIAINNNGPSPQIGWIDSQGTWIPKNSYQLIGKSTSTNNETNTTALLPKLKVIGQVEQYRSDWPQFYQAINQVNLPISEVNWQDPTNIILQTAIGTVQLGPYSGKIPLQLQTLDKMRLLPQQTDINNIAYIDIKNPNAPWLQLKSLK